MIKTESDNYTVPNPNTIFSSFDVALNQIPTTLASWSTTALGAKKVMERENPPVQVFSLRDPCCHRGTVLSSTSASLPSGRMRFDLPTRCRDVDLRLNRLGSGF